MEETSTVSEEIIGAGNQIMHMVLDPGITNFLAVLCIVILIALPTIAVWLLFIYAKSVRKGVDVLETIADQTEQHTKDHTVQSEDNKLIKEKVSEACQGIEILKDREKRQ